MDHPLLLDERALTRLGFSLSAADMKLLLCRQRGVKLAFSLAR